MFQVGDTIIYTTYGICRIDDCVKKEFNGEIKDYYILKPLNDSKASLQIQVDNPITREKLRSILSENEALELISNVPSIEPYWIENENERKRHFSTILRCGHRNEIIAIIKSIFEHSKGLKDKGRKLHACDEQYCKDAEKIIYEELAYVLKKEKREIQDIFIENLK
ncbi:MAG: CarD family transcriptional regulator [Erysipelotrichaceae bacterium]|nr:CarD family transcriptional regulator [Erysipelotrichaceae bacterium]